jgi:hypothetical protein
MADRRRWIKPRRTWEHGRPAAWLDYAIAWLRRIHTVDVNPHQTALLEQKLADIRRPGVRRLLRPVQQRGPF